MDICCVLADGYASLQLRAPPGVMLASPRTEFSYFINTHIDAVTTSLLSVLIVIECSGFAKNEYKVVYVKGNKSFMIQEIIFLQTQIHAIKTMSDLSSDYKVQI